MSNSAEISFEDQGISDALKKLRKKWKDIEGRKEFGGIISSVVYSDIIDHFKDEEGPGGKWDSWSSAYEKHLKDIGRGGNKILQFSGKLRQTFTPNSWKGQRDGILFFNQAKTKTGFPYAQHHDEGKSSSEGNPRSFMWLSKGGIQKLVDITLKWLAE